MNAPLVTISIPIYNCENHLINCLQSVVNQKYKNLEVQLVDDLGNDNSMQVAEDFIQKHPDFHFKILRNEKNSGLSVVRNVGIDNAQGKYIFFLDSDDEITPDCISKMVEIAEREHVEMVCGNVRTIKLESKEEIDAFKLHNTQEKITNNTEIFECFIQGRFPVPSWNKLILLDFLKQNKLYFKEGLFAQDSLQSFETALVLNSVFFLRDDTYIYYLHQDSVIHNRKKKHFDNWITIATEFEKHYQKEQNPERKIQILGYLIDYKDLTLLMNWKAQRNEELWKYSYNAYKKLASFSLVEYLSSDFNLALKKKNFLQNLPTNLGYKIFRKRFGN
jgi:glycosyltransferase involved in cell wall biosynthesis